MPTPENRSFELLTDTPLIIKRDKDFGRTYDFMYRARRGADENHVMFFSNEIAEKKSPIYRSSRNIHLQPYYE